MKTFKKISNPVEIKIKYSGKVSNKIRPTKLFNSVKGGNVNRLLIENLRL